MKRYPSPAKLNLFLYITGRRPNSHYHNLQTLFQFIDFCDYLSFKEREDHEINLLTPFPNVPLETNLIMIAAKVLQSYLLEHKLPSQCLGVDIEIEKYLPMGGGIGGASSNAATTLVALNELWQAHLELDVLLDLGRKIGADVPIFIYGHAAFAEGIGDKFQAVSVHEKWYLVARPDVEISTAAVFRDPELTRDSITKNLTELLHSPFKNDCESVVRKRYPQVDKVIRYLSQYAPTRLTGTGSCIFAECHDQAHAIELQTKLTQTMQIKSYVTKGLNRSPLYS